MPRQMGQRVSIPVSGGQVRRSRDQVRPMRTRHSPEYTDPPNFGHEVKSLGTRAW